MEELDELLDQYWTLSWREATENVSYGDEAGLVLHKIHKLSNQVTIGEYTITTDPENNKLSTTERLFEALTKAEERRGDGLLYWIELHGDGGGSIFCEINGDMGYFNNLEEAIRKINRLGA